MGPMRHLPLVLTALTLSIAACEEKAPPPPPRSAAPKAAAPTTPPAPAQAVPSAPTGGAPAAALGSAVSVMGLSLTVPEGWKQVPPANSMRLAEIQVPDASGDAAKACSIAFSTAGGDVQSNIDRWAGQVHDASGQPATPKTDSRTVGGLKVTVTELAGSYAGMGDPAPHTNWMLRGAIIETPQGLLFVKMTGPAEQMAASAKAFNAMIDGLKKS